MAPCCARVILATAPSSKAMSGLIDGLGPNGKLIDIGLTSDPIEVTPLQLISGSLNHSRLVCGHASRFRGLTALRRTEWRASHD